MVPNDSLDRAISAASGEPFHASELRRVGGGDINACYRLSDTRRSFFVKFNAAARLDMFEAEAAALHAIRATQTVRAPCPVAVGIRAGQAFLVLDYLDLRRHGNAAQLGQQLAALHRTTQAGFGWSRDNTLGSTPQANPATASWVEFLREHRLGAQLRRAAANGYSGALQAEGEKLLARLDAFFDAYRPQPSLLHGDLWGGNHAYLADGSPVVFDPATYYGDRECDLAMSELFGGFAPAFHAAYRDAWPLDPGYAQRKHLYNLYHLLNHANLFGGGYPAQALATMRRLNALTG
jgi:fructosamine-3-kinase